MTQTFSLTGFAAFVVTLAETEHVKEHALKKAARIVENEAKRVIGTYDYGWPPLAESTLKKKAADTPLLETGELQKSIGSQVDHDRALIGSDDKVAVWQELGTKTIPPRPFLMGALVHKTKEVLEVIGRHYEAHLTGAKTDAIE
jgi:phage gpG-like protein